MNTTKIISKIQKHKDLKGLAEKSGVSWRTLYYIKAGNLPSLKTLTKLERHL